MELLNRSDCSTERIFSTIKGFFKRHIFDNVSKCKTLSLMYLDPSDHFKKPNHLSLAIYMPYCK